MEHIKNIEIKNFKSIRHQKIEDCRRVNVFIGYPNVGKSNILEALGLFGVILSKNQYFKFNEICRVKHFSELYFNRDIRDAARVTLNDKKEVELIIDDSNELQVRINNVTIAKENRNANNTFSVSVNSRDFELRMLNQSSISSNDSQEIRKYEFHKNILINSRRPRALAIPNGNNLLEVLLGNSELRKEVVAIFKEYGLKLNLDTVDESIKFIKELDDQSIVTIPYHQVADTLQRLIFYKAAVLSNRESILLFEEPEAHMFPPYISKFTSDIILDEKDNQFFVATHSPFVINDLMEELKNDELSIYVVGYKKDVGETIIRKLTGEELHEIYQYGIDIFYNLENYLMHEQQ